MTKFLLITSMYRNNYCIGNRYIVESAIGAGSFGEVYRARDLNTDQTVAIKAEYRNVRNPMVKFEAHIYRLLKSNKGFPEYITHGVDRGTNTNYLVTTLLGPTLEDMFNICGRKFSLKTTLLIFI